MMPPFLTAGARVALFAPGRRVSIEMVTHAEQVLREWGYNVARGASVLNQTHAYHGATAQERLADFQRLIDDPTVRAIFCIRGGYGTTQFLDAIDWRAFRQSPKWIVGFSDVTALHLQLLSIGCISIHGLMPVQYPKAGQAEPLAHLKEILMGNLQPLQWSTHPANRPGHARGILAGGNLSLLADSLGTKSAPDMRGKILVMEEVDEPLYKVDRMLTQLQRSGMFSNLAALLAGYFTGIHHTDIAYSTTVEEMILSKVPAGLPVAFGFPSGHEAPNYSWLSWAEAAVAIGESSRLHYV